MALKKIPVGFWVAALFLVLGFGLFLYQLAIHALGSELHSHILLIPILVLVLLFGIRGKLPEEYSRSKFPAAVFGLAGIGLLTYGILFKSAISENDWLSITTGSFVLLLVGTVFFFLGRKWVKTAAFPLFFLIFMVPVPDVAVRYMESFLTRATAESLVPLFQLSGIPALRDGQVFHVPGITIEVARQCSGIRSTLVLFIVGTLMAGVFLRSTWSRTLLIALLFPLGILRNSFRILVIAMLCVQRGPEMINSAIHRNGGPWFFGLSLIVLFMLLWIFRWIESRVFSRKRKKKKNVELESGVRLAEQE